MPCPSVLTPFLALGRLKGSMQLLAPAREGGQERETPNDLQTSPLCQKRLVRNAVSSWAQVLLLSKNFFVPLPFLHPCQLCQPFRFFSLVRQILQLAVPRTPGRADQPLQVVAVEQGGPCPTRCGKSLREDGTLCDNAGPPNELRVAPAPPALRFDYQPIDSSPPNSAVLSSPSDGLPPAHSAALANRQRADGTHLSSSPASSYLPIQG
mmetsp:Transcript_49813/g.98884  ORF Transcript_49813/g.98884 Transcript_49813/m.98884 type:complete len:209 (-) Transcript_49813:224-850(-)